MRTSIAARANLELIDQNYQRWQEDPASVDPSWAAFFEGFELGNLPQRNGAAGTTAQRAGVRESPMQTRIDGLVYAYRTLGHTIARVNPLAEKRPENPQLTLRELGFSEKDLDLRVSSKFFLDNEEMKLREMIARLEKIYADSIGAEFMHIQNTRIRNWVLHRLESRPDKRHTARAVQIALLRALLEAESFEVFLHSRYVGQKRFSLQGAESLMVILDTILHKCPAAGVEEICMGMAHRGRLNVLANFLKMSQLHGYGTGGTVHIVVNNQIGFTTLPEDARSSMYATDVAKMIEVPIFHVNGDD